MNHSRRSLRKGFAMVVVLLLSMVLLMLITSLFFRSNQQKSTLPYNHDQTKALFVAKGILQLALYKVKVLPADFYKAHIAALNGRPEQYNRWMIDFDVHTADSIAHKIIAKIPDEIIDAPIYDAGISSFSVRMKQSGFQHDLVFIAAWGKCRNQVRTVENLVEVNIQVD